MLNRMSSQPLQCVNESVPHVGQEKSRYTRNECDDMKRGIELLYEFHRKLSELHPNVVDMVECLLQRPRY